LVKPCSPQYKSHLREFWTAGAYQRCFRTKQSHQFCLVGGRQTELAGILWDEKKPFKRLSGYDVAKMEINLIQKVLINFKYHERSIISSCWSFNKFGIWKKRWVTIMMDVPCNQFWFDFWYRYRNLDCWCSRCISCKMENHWLKKIARIKSMNTVRFIATKIYLLWRYRVYGISCLSEGHPMMAQPACNKEILVRI
jgi:hypothetical protein